jgi:hypothetical protein
MNLAVLVLQMRARLWLFVSFLMAAGAVAGSVAVLVATQGKELISVGVVSTCWPATREEHNSGKAEEHHHLAALAGERAAVRSHLGVFHFVLVVPLWRQGWLRLHHTLIVMPVCSL